MRRASALWEVFVLRFEEALERYRKRRLTADEAGELLGMSGRHFRRLTVRYDEEGAEGLRDRRLGRVSPRRAPAAELTRMQILYQERYRDFTVKHFHEQLQKRHNYRLGYTVTRLSLQGAGLVARHKRRGGTHRKKRARRPLPGMLLFQDGSTHRWIGALEHDLDLIVTLDDATGAIYSALLVEEEGTMSSFLGLAETIAAHGLFRAFIPTAGHTTFLRRRPAAKSTSRSRPKLAAPWRSSASPTSRPTRPRRAAAWSGCSAPCKAGCRRNCAWPRSLQPRPPTAISKSSSCPTTTRASRCRRPRRARPSSPTLVGARRHPVHPGKPPGRPRQLRQLEWDQPTNPAVAPSPSLRQGDRAGAPIPDGQLAIFDGPSCLARFDATGKPIDVSRAA